MDRMKDNIRRAMRDQISESFVFPIDESTIVDYKDYEFDSSYDETLDEGFEGNQTQIYKTGDIVMTRFTSPDTSSEVDAHRFLLVTDGVEKGSGLIEYTGFIMDSIHRDNDKSNKANPNKYPDNIYIKDYASTLYRSPRNVDHKECMIKVDRLIRFTNEGMDTSGTWKGTVSRSFMNFVMNRYNNRNTRKNSYKYWLGRLTSTGGNNGRYSKKTNGES